MTDNAQSTPTDINKLSNKVTTIEIQLVKVLASIRNSPATALATDPGPSGSAPAPQATDPARSPSGPTTSAAGEAYKVGQLQFSLPRLQQNLWQKPLILVTPTMKLGSSTSLRNPALWLPFQRSDSSQSRGSLWPYKDRRHARRLGS